MGHEMSSLSVASAMQSMGPAHAAVMAGNCGALRQLIGDHPECVGSRMSDGSTPLHVAAFGGNCELAHILLEAGADVNAETNSKMRPVHQACRKGYRQMAELLRSHGAEMCAADNDGESCLHFAAQGGDEALVRWLVEDCGLDVNAANKTDEGAFTPAHFAARCGHLSVVRTLIRFGTNVDAQKGDLWSLLHLAAANGHVELTKFLVEECHANVHLKNSAGKTPLEVTTSDAIIRILRGSNDGRPSGGCKSASSSKSSDAGSGSDTSTSVRRAQQEGPHEATAAASASATTTTHEVILKMRETIDLQAEELRETRTLVQQLNSKLDAQQAMMNELLASLNNRRC